MEIRTSLDWAEVSSELRTIGNKTHRDPKLNKLLNNIGEMVRVASNMEIEIRRKQSIPSKYTDLIAKINEEIQNLEMLLLMATLAK